MLASSVITNAPDSYSTHRDNDDNVEESSILNFSSDLNFNVSYDECHIHVEENGAPFLDKITLEKNLVAFLILHKQMARLQNVAVRYR